MRKTLSLLALLLMISLTSKAQFFGGGLLGGFDVSQVDGDGIGGYNKPGIIAGGYVDYTFTPKITGVLELKYIQKGRVRNADINNEDTEYFKMALDYIQLPVILNYDFGKGFKGEIGIGMAYLFNSRFYDYAGKVPNKEMGYEFNSFELSSTLGVRYEISEKWFVTARWSMSFLPAGNILSNDYETPSYINPFQAAGDQYNRTLEFTLGYVFGKP